MAANYKILYLNYPKLWIDGKPANVGDVFSSDASITWFKEKQAMKVLNLETRERLIWPGNPLEKKKESVLEILTRTGQLSAHGPGDNEDMGSFDILENSIMQKYALLDSIFIPVPPKIEVNENNYFLASYRYGDTRISKRLGYKDGYMIIDRSIFMIEGKALEPRDIELIIDYIVTSPANSIFIKDNIQLTVIPLTLE